MHWQCSTASRKGRQPLSVLGNIPGCSSPEHRPPLLFPCQTGPVYPASTLPRFPFLILHFTYNMIVVFGMITEVRHRLCPTVTVSPINFPCGCVPPDGICGNRSYPPYESIPRKETPKPSDGGYFVLHPCPPLASGNHQLVLEARMHHQPGSRKHLAAGWTSGHSPLYCPQ